MNKHTLSLAFLNSLEDLTKPGSWYDAAKKMCALKTRKPSSSTPG
jgi:hypothetical protein